MALAMENVEKSSSSGLLVNLNELFSTTTNIICRITSGRKYSEDTNKFKKLLTEFTELFGTSDVRDRLTRLAWVSHVNGFNAKAKEFDEFLDGVGEEHMNSQNQQINDHKEIQGEDQKDYVDVLLEIQRQNKSGFPMESTNIKALILVRTKNSTRLPSPKHR
ncbi:hypothetical protein V6N13_096523 [Hibiscus sabdariffa]